MLFNNNINISEIKQGIFNIAAVYLGYNLIFGSTRNSYLTFEALEDNTVIKFYNNSDNSANNKTIEVSTDKVLWISKTSSNSEYGTILGTLNAGECLYLRGDNAAYGYYDDEHIADIIGNTLYADK